MTNYRVLLFVLFLVSFYAIFVFLFFFFSMQIVDWKLLHIQSYAFWFSQLNSFNCNLYFLCYINVLYFLYQVHEELVQAIKDAEDGLFHLKRARLLQEADFALQSCYSTAKDIAEEPFDPKDVLAEPIDKYSVGSKCRFRHSDGRWYNGQIVRLEGSNAAKVSFLTPTSETMLVRPVLSLSHSLLVSCNLYNFTLQLIYYVENNFCFGMCIHCVYSLFHFTLLSF